MKYSISVVSHNSGKYLEALFMDLSYRFPSQAEVILTINIPENEFYLRSAVNLKLKIIRNCKPLGFGANHNQAFYCSTGQRFVIVNPDIRLRCSLLSVLDNAFDNDTGACAPMVLSSDGIMEDSVRCFPTIGKLFRRVVLGSRTPDYIPAEKFNPIVVDWAAGMFVMFDSSSFKAVGGFDTRYFMYVEDADICHRLGMMGKKIVWVPECSVIHDAQRASRKCWKHRFWHLSSMVRFLFRM